MNHHYQDILNLAKDLRRADEEVGIDVLRILQGKNMSKCLLESTKIGAAVREFGKRFRQNIQIKALSSDIIKDWKVIYYNVPVSSGDVGITSRAAEPRFIRHPFSETCTITFGDQAENHVGMQKIGSLADEGFSKEDLDVAKRWFDERGIVTEIIALHTSLPSELQLQQGVEAYVLIARGGVSALLESSSAADRMMREQGSLDRDTKAFMKGKVVNKHARFNLCFGDFDQEPDYENKKGRVISFGSVPLLQQMRGMWREVIGNKGSDLEAEGNYYYDVAKCGIGYHGDTERRKVIAVRLGHELPLCYVWFQNSTVVSERVELMLGHGDIYFMSEKATGQDWLKKKILTLRHAAGSEKYIRIPKKNVK